MWGHVGRAHGKKLQDLQNMSSFTSGYISLHKGQFPNLESVKCCCVGRKHVFVATANKPVCGCIGRKTDEDGFYGELKCPGEPYRSSHVLKYKFRALAYQIECEERAKEAEKVIDPGVGKGHSNLPESTFSVLAEFRAKDINLHQKHYQASTNLGLIQASMTWCYKNRGPDYQWIAELYTRIGLPVLDGIQEMVCFRF